MKQKREELVSLFLRIGIVTTLFYAAIASFLNPLAWIGFIPSWIEVIISREIFLSVYSAYEIILGIWLLSNKKIFYASILSALTMFVIVVFNLGAFDIVFRDIAILFAAIALVVLSYRKR